jgi:hypothetical protein
MRRVLAVFPSSCSTSIRCLQSLHATPSWPNPCRRTAKVTVIVEKVSRSVLQITATFCDPAEMTNPELRWTVPIYVVLAYDVVSTCTVDNCLRIHAHFRCVAEMYSSFLSGSEENPMSTSVSRETFNKWPNALEGQAEANCESKTVVYANDARLMTALNTPLPDRAVRRERAPQWRVTLPHQRNVP